MKNYYEFVPLFSKAHLNKVQSVLMSLRLEGKYNLYNFLRTLVLRPQRINIMSFNL